MLEIEEKILEYIREYIKENGAAPIKSEKMQKDLGVSGYLMRKYISFMSNRGQILCVNNGKNGIAFDLPLYQPSKDQMQRNLLVSAIAEISIKDVKRYYEHIVAHNDLKGFPNEW